MTILSYEEERALRDELPALRRRNSLAARAIRRVLAMASADTATASVNEAARVFGVTPQTVRNWVDRGWLPGERAFGRGARRIPRSVIERAAVYQRPIRGRHLSEDEIAAIIAEPRRQRIAAR